MKRINKYLFLDVDGVLNSVSWYREEWNKDHVYPQGGFDIEVEADSEDEAWEKAYDTVDLGDLEVRDCEYSDDEITLLEE